jgi:type IV pilus assembly protein PilF
MARWRPEAMLLLAFFHAAVFSLCHHGGDPPRIKKKAAASRNLGEAYLSEKNYTAALGELLKAERLNPEDPILQNDLGLVYMAKEKIRSGRGAF